MIYVSSSCVRASSIREAVIALVEQGIKNIELSGGTKPYDNFENDLLELKDKYNLNSDKLMLQPIDDDSS